MACEGYLYLESRIFYVVVEAGVLSCYSTLRDYLSYQSAVLFLELTSYHCGLEKTSRYPNSLNPSCLPSFRLIRRKQIYYDGRQGPPLVSHFVAPSLQARDLWCCRLQYWNKYGWEKSYSIASHKMDRDALQILVKYMMLPSIEKQGSICQQSLTHTHTSKCSLNIKQVQHHSETNVPTKCNHDKDTSLPTSNGHSIYKNSYHSTWSCCI